MTIILLSIILFLIFTILGGFHFYWLFGGVWGLKKVIPTKSNDLHILAIPKFATLVVGVVLILFGLMYLMKSGFVNLQIHSQVVNYVYWFIPFVFIVRAIGEFKYLGLFKRIKDTEFAKADSKFFSPLCLIVGIIGLFIQFLTEF